MSQHPNDVNREKKPEKRQRGMRKGLYVFNAMLSGPISSDIEGIANYVSRKIFGERNVSVCIDKSTVKSEGDGTYECTMVVDRMGQHNEVTRNKLSGESEGHSWSLLEASDIENWKQYYRSVAESGFCQYGVPLEVNAHIVYIFKKALETKSITECRSYTRSVLNPLEWSTYGDRILRAWSEKYKEIRSKKRVTELYPVNEDSGCVKAIRDWIKEVFLGPCSRPKTLFIVGETRSGKSMTVSNFLVDKDWLEYQAFDVSAKDRYGEQKLFRILDDATFGIHTVDVLKMYLNSVDSNVNVKYGETMIVPIPTIILLNKMNFVEILRDFTDKQWLGGNIVVYPEQDEETFKVPYVYESRIAEMSEKLYDETKPMKDYIRWEDTMFYQTLNITQAEFNNVYKSMVIGDDIWKAVRKYLRGRN